MFDLGHYSLRAGYAGEEAPKSEIPATVGMLEEAGSAAQIGTPMEVDSVSANKETTAPKRKYYIDTNALHVPKKGEMNVLRSLLPPKLPCL